jgi:hypothetical protein
VRHFFTLVAVSLIIRTSQAEPPASGTHGVRLDRPMSFVANRVQAAQDAKRILTWEDYGCKPDDPTFDNGPVLSRMIADQAVRKLKTAPLGTLADFFIKTPIDWPGVYGCALEGSGGYAFGFNGHDNLGATRIIWNGPAGGTMLNYRGCGGRIGRLMLRGVDWHNPTSYAGCGIEVSAHTEPPAGTLTTDQLAIINCDIGIHCLASPDNNHADQMKHFGLLFHGVKTCYWVEGEQSCPHNFYDVDIRNGWETAFKFDRGGALSVFGCYVGGDESKKLQTLLYLGQPNYNNGFFHIYSLQADNSIQNLRLLDHGKFAPSVVIRGNAGNHPASPMILNRFGPSPYNKNIDVKSFTVNSPEGAGT